MAFDPLTALFEAGKLAVERIWPDPIKRAEEIRKLEELKQKGDIEELNGQVKLLMGQIEINIQEAKHKSVFVAGWRPFIGWVGGFSLAYAGLIYPLLCWLLVVLQIAKIIPAAIEPPPMIESGAIGGIVTGMLGIGGMRSFDKRNGVQTDKIS